MTNATLRSTIQVISFIIVIPLRAHLRLQVVTLCLLFCLTLALVAFTSTRGFTQIFFATAALLASIVLTNLQRQEQRIAQDHLIATAKVASVRIGRRGRVTAEYLFTALDGKSYSGSANWRFRKVQPGTEILVLYKTTEPRINRPLAQFLFYSFRQTVPL